jgi:NADH-quinone oxidoreductase subunit N
MSVVQDIDWLAVAPPTIVALLALGVLVADLFVPVRARAVLGWVVAGGLVVAALPLLAATDRRRATFCVPGGEGVLPSCSYVVDGLTLALQVLVLGGAAIVALLSIDSLRDERIPAGEYWFLLLASVAGALTLVAARDLITVVVALEVVSLPTFALVGLRRFSARSGEAALKFFLVSVVSSALMLYGVSLVYGVTGAVHLDRVATALEDPALHLPVTTVGVLLTVAGFAFKVAAVPFHFWAPDVYVGAPLPVTAYLSVVSKAAGFAGLVIVLAVGFEPYADTWAPVVAVLAALTMTVGNLVALTQRSAVRLLAWSSIAQSGYMLVPFAGARVDPEEAVGATVAYVLAYAVMNLGAFAVVTLVGRHRPANRLDDYRGLARTEPLTAAALVFALACLAGLPPGLLGLFAKVVVFQAPVAGGVGWLAVVMAVNVALGLYYYLYWGASLYGRPADGASPPSYRMSVPDGLAVGATLGAAVTFSLLPGVVLGALAAGAPFLG